MNIKTRRYVAIFITCAATLALCPQVHLAPAPVGATGHVNHRPAHQVDTTRQGLVNHRGGADLHPTALGARCGGPGFNPCTVGQRDRAAIQPLTPDRNLTLC